MGWGTLMNSGDSLVLVAVMLRCVKSRLVLFAVVIERPLSGRISIEPKVRVRVKIRVRFRVRRILSERGLGLGLGSGLGLDM